MLRLTLALFMSISLATACGDDSGGNGDDDGGTNGDGGANVDADPNAPDGNSVIRPDGAPCVPGNTECSDCIDNDGDGDIDGFDVECISAADNREDSFATGIPGDNMDPNKQDCFFDGNSGAGDDGCDFDTCCLLGNCQAGTDCSITQECIDNCLPLTPPGCDCFGCCTICDDQGCEDIVINPAVAPNCDETLIHDPNACPQCTLNTDCGTPCVNDDCQLCPGQDLNDLPDTCFGVECPGGQTECASTADCGAMEFCANGCCIPQID